MRSVPLRNGRSVCGSSRFSSRRTTCGGGRMRATKAGNVAISSAVASRSTASTPSDAKQSASICRM